MTLEEEEGRRTSPGEEVRETGGLLSLKTTGPRGTFRLSPPSGTPTRRREPKEEDRPSLEVSPLTPNPAQVRVRGRVSSLDGEGGEEERCVRFLEAERS